MRLLFCQQCGDLRAPVAEARRPRFCACGRHSVWWADRMNGMLVICDGWGQQEERPGYPRGRMAYAWEIHLADEMLRAPVAVADPPTIAKVMSIESEALLRLAESPAIKYRPGETDDSSWGWFPSHIGDRSVA